MFTHTKSKTLTEVNCSPGASTEVVKKDKKATVRPRTTRLASGRSRKSRKEEAQPDAATTCDRREEQDQAAPYLPGAHTVSCAGTLTAMDSAPERKRSGITLDLCGKAGDPHNLEVERGTVPPPSASIAPPPPQRFSISIKRRRTLDAGWDLAADEAGSSAADAILAA
jgi:hypothetical protein